MSPDEDEYNDGDISSGLFQTTKKRRIQRACDVCRKKKIRCDGVQMPENRCTNCISCNSNCTYIEAVKKRGPQKGYLENMENRVDKLEKLLWRLCPDEALFEKLYASLDGDEILECPPVGDIAKQAQPIATNLESVASALRGAMEVNRNADRPSTDDDDDDDPTLVLADNLKRMALTPNSFRFLGKSSGAMLVRSAIELRNEYTGDEGMFGDPEKPALKYPRTEFSTVKPWERKSDETPTASPRYNFPDFDLALHCIDLYFKFSNLYLPLLHRPTFDKCVREGHHLTNERFASVFLLVCAVGARYSDDPRVLLDGVDTYHSAGWKWFEQVQIMKISLLSPPSLYDLQLYCLCVQYLIGSSSPQSCWTVAGIGIRLAQDVGAHRRKVHNHTHTPEDELWKRAFWVLICMDRIVSSSLGRSCAIQDEEFDLDLPVDCDDEYWDNADPEKRFKQPPNKPSSVTAFILYLKLQQILAFSLRTIYSMNKVKILVGLAGQRWEEPVIVELDSALNKWVDSVPEHLRWDPNQKENNFFNQSVSLYATYYHIQIIIHRPFIPSPSKPSPLSFPSLAICTNAARSCSHIVDIQRKRKTTPPPLIQMPVFTSGIVLLLGIWGGKSSGLSTDFNKEMADVHKCMKVLKTLEARWYSAGRLWDVLYELSCKGELPLPQPSPPSMEQGQESDTPSSTSASESSLSGMSQNDILEPVAGSRRVHQESMFFGQTQQQKPLPQPQPTSPPSAMRTSHFDIPPPQQMPSRRRSHSQIQQNRESEQSTPTVSPFINADPPVFALPVYSNELGRVPLNGQVTFTAQAHHPQPQIHWPQLHPQVNHWYTIPGSASSQGSERSDPPPDTGHSGASPSYWPHSPPVAPHQEQRYPLHPNHSLPSFLTNGFSSLLEMSPMTHGQYGMDAAQMATNMRLDSEATLGYTQQQTSNCGLERTDSFSPRVASNLTASLSPQSSSGSSIENVYAEMGMDMSPDHSGGHLFHQHQHQHQGAPQQQGQLPLTYPFDVGSDAVDIWSNALAGFELGDRGTYLTRFGS